MPGSAPGRVRPPPTVASPRQTSPGGADQPASGRGKARGDAVFGLIILGAGLLVLLLLGAIVVFLVVQAVPAFRQAGAGFFTVRQWLPDSASPHFGIAALAWGTVLSSAIALLIATPVALGTALYLTEVARPRVSRTLGWLVDLLAAVPSVVYGLWGVAFLVPLLVPFERGVDGFLGFIPFLHSPNHTYGRSVFAASVVLAIMILPIIAAISREVLRQVPGSAREAALALGATRWETIRMAVLPPSRSGLIGAIMLGLGRAIGETIAVALVLSASFKITFHIFQPGGNTIAANIATKFGEAGANGRAALIASGLVLFVISLAVNLAARLVVRRDPGVRGRPALRDRLRRLTRLTRLTRLPRLRHPHPVHRHRGLFDWSMRGLMAAAVVVALVPLVAVLAYTAHAGARDLSGSFLTHSLRGVGPLDPAGGAYHAIVGTVEQVGMAALVSIPLGLLVAVFLVEQSERRLADWIRFVVDVMTGIPSIVAGLFIFAFWVLGLGLGFSGVAASLALAVLMLPIVIRSSEEMIKLVPSDLREASYALGVSRWRTVCSVVLPTAAAGITTGVVLAVARVTGEAAPLLLTAFGFDSIKVNPFHGPQSSLPLFVFSQATSAFAVAVNRAWAAALVLILIVVALTVVARVVTRRNRLV